MRAGPLRTFAIAAVIGVGLVGCGSSSTSTPGTAGSAPTAGETGGGLASPVEGVPIDVEAEGFTDVEAFTIRTDDGRQLRFVLGPLENAAEFPPTHLAEHLAGSTKIRVFFRPDGADEVVYRLEDV